MDGIFAEIGNFNLKQYRIELIYCFRAIIPEMLGDLVRNKFGLIRAIHGEAS